MTLIHLFPVVATEQCKRWKKYFVEVIDTEETHSYPLKDEAIYSYQLEPLISYRNSTTGEWQFFNLSGNVLVMQNGPDPWSWQIKVTVCYFSNFIEANWYLKDTLL